MSSYRFQISNPITTDVIEQSIRDAGFSVSGIEIITRTVSDTGHVSPLRSPMFVVHGTDATRREIDALIKAHIPFYDHVNKKIKEIKALAGRKILSIAPEWRQRNMIARSLELERKERLGEILTRKELAEFNTYTAIWERIKAIRFASGVVETKLLTLSDKSAGNFDIKQHTSWPE